MNQASGIPVPGVSEALQTASVSFGILATIMSMLNNSGLPSTGDAVLDALRARYEKIEALHREVLASIDRVGEQIGVLQKQTSTAPCRWRSTCPPGCGGWPRCSGASYLTPPHLRSLPMSMAATF